MQIDLTTLKGQRKSYLTKERLEAALEKLGFQDCNYVICKATDKDRYTAVFFGSDAMNLGVFQHGFLIVG